MYLMQKVDQNIFIQCLSAVLSGERGTEADSHQHFDRLTSLYPSFWLGYPFSTKLKSEFNVTNHVNYVNPPRGGQNFMDVNNMICEWLSSPFPRGQPLWDIMITSGYIKLIL